MSRKRKSKQLRLPSAKVMLCVATHEAAHKATFNLCTGLPTRRSGKRSSGPATRQTVPVRPVYVAPAETAVNKVNRNTRTNDNILSVISDSGIIFTGLVNHSVTCVLLDTGATVSALRKSTWEKSGHVSKFKPVEVTLTKAKGNELTVLGEAEVRFRIGGIDCSLSVMIARGPSHNCIVYWVQSFVSTMGVKFTVTKEPLWRVTLKFQSGTARLHLLTVFVELFCVLM